MTRHYAFTGNIDYTPHGKAGHNSKSLVVSVNEQVRPTIYETHHGPTVTDDPTVVRKPRRTVNAMGHRFDPDLFCTCGVHWGHHQLFQNPCGGELDEDLREELPTGVGEATSAE